MQIRAADPAELAEIGDIRVATYRADGFLPAASEYAATLRSLGADGGHILVAVADDGELLGTVMLQRWPQAGQVVTGPDEAEIRALAVRPAARGSGIGRALLAAVIALAGQLSIRHLVLCTQSDMKSAQRLYQRAGFARLPERDWSPVPGVTLLAYGLAMSALVS